MLCKFLLPVLFLSAFLLVPQTAGAQGTYTCSWHTTNPTTGKGACKDPIDKCEKGFFVPKKSCEGFNNIGECITERSCIESFTSDCPRGGRGINTALGCIPTENTTEFVKWFLRWAIGIAGGIAFLLILSSGFQIMTSSGNPEKLKGGQEQLTAAISGLLLIIFSVFLLRLIGVDILKLPGFGN